MTPDHLHATISIAAMRKGKHVLVHKPLSNKVAEVEMVVESARKTGVATHLLAWRAPLTPVRQMILDGAIGELKEVHNWTDRPFWPQQLAMPTDRPPIPPNFNWDLWLGPETVIARIIRATHTPSSAAGMTSVEAASPIWAITACGPSSWRWICRCAVERRGANELGAMEINDQVSTIKMNDFAFPYANRVCFKFAAHGRWPAMKLYWYDGGMRPFTPDELLSKTANPFQRPELFSSATRASSLITTWFPRKK